MKRIVSIVMLMIIVAMLAACGDAYDILVGESQGLKFELDDNNPYYVVTGIGTCTDKIVKIPEKHDGLPVKMIAVGAFRHCETIERVVIPSGVTYIGSEAFYKSSVQEVVIPEGVEHIGSHTFSGSDIKRITIPGSVEYIYENCFSGCKNLEEITLTEGLVGIGALAFHNCDKIGSINIPNTVEKVNKHAFYETDNLTIHNYTNKDLSYLFDVSSDGKRFIGDNCAIVDH